MNSLHIKFAKVPRKPGPDVLVAAEHVGHLLEAVVVGEVHQRQLVRAVAGRELAVAVEDILDLDGCHEGRDDVRLEPTLVVGEVIAVFLVLVLPKLFLRAEAPLALVAVEAALVSFDLLFLGLRLLKHF